MSKYWSVPREWAGETCFILAGGASLTGFDAEILRGRGRVIAIKDAAFVFAPWADCLYWADKVWCDGDKKRPPRGNALHLHTGRYKVTRTACKNTNGHDVKLLACDQKAGLSGDPSTLGGICSGGNAINLAYLFGVKRIVLLGFDMKGPNWDGRPRLAEQRKRYAQHFMPAIGRMAAPLKAAGVEVLNANPDSALECFPKTTLEAILSKEPTKAAETKPAAAPAPAAKPEAGAAKPAETPAEGKTAAVNPAGSAAPRDPGEAKPAETPAADAGAGAAAKPDADAGDAPAQDPEPAPEPALAPPRLIDARLEQQPNPMEVDQAITDLRRHGAVALRIRTQGADIVMRRSADWWEAHLRVVFPIVTSRALGKGVVLFECRNPRV